MYQHALDKCNQALGMNSNHEKTKYRKAKALAYLFEFDEARRILPGNHELVDLID